MQGLPKGWLPLAALLWPLSVGATRVPFDGVASIANGAFHSCAVNDAGRVYCWGANDRGQLGDGTMVDRNLPTEVPGLSGVRAVAGGNEHTCALLQGGEVQCWGGNDKGQLGLGDTLSRATPTAVPGLTAVRALALGGMHSCVITEGQTVKCWGEGTEGQLGDGERLNRSSPVDVLGLTGVTSLAADGDYSENGHTCAVVEGGAVKCWGSNFFGQLGIGDRSVMALSTTPVDVPGLSSGAAQVTLGDIHSCVVMQDGGMKCWGRNRYGQLGDGSAEVQQSMPVDVVDLDADVSSAAAASFHTCALLVNAQLRCWGNGGTGVLGDGSSAQPRRPVAVVGLGGTPVQLTTGGNGGNGHTCVRLDSGQMECWGSNYSGELGDGSTGLGRLAPTSVSGLGSGVRGIGASRSSCAIDGNGSLSCWGDNAQGGLGDGSTEGRLLPAQVVGLASGVRQVSVDSSHTCAVTVEGAAKCWGINQWGNLGNGTTTTAANPEPVDVIGLASGVRAVATGQTHSCAVLDDGSARCWGQNFAGQLGDDGNTTSSTPVNVLDLTDATDIGAGASHSCALRSSGGVSCWGDNASGQLGLGHFDQQRRPQPVIELGGSANQLAVGQNHACAIVAGSVRCWGNNSSGQLGDGSTDNRATPVPVTGLGEVMAISAGTHHSCAVTTAGALWCWGGNLSGQLGDGSTVGRLAPTPVSGLSSGVTAVAAGVSHSCAIAAGGAMLCWGGNSAGQIGDGSADYRPLPAAVVTDASALVEREVAPVTEEVPNADSVAAVSDGAGHYIAFQSSANNLVEADGNAGSDIYRVDTRSGEIERISVDTDGNEVSGSSIEPSISADGQLLLFVAPDDGVQRVAGEGKRAAEARRKAGNWGVYLRNMLTATTRRLGTGVAAGVGTQPQVAPGGVAATFVSDALAEAPGQTQIAVVALQPSEVLANERLPSLPVCVSCKAVDAAGRDTAEPVDGGGRHPAISADGQWLAWESDAKNALAGADPSCPEAGAVVLLRHLPTGQLQRIGAPSGDDCGSPGAASGKPRLDYSGQKLVFESSHRLTAGDRNGVADVFLFERGQTLARLSEGAGAVEGNAASGQASLSGDGRMVAFVSAATNLDSRAADDNEAADIYVRPVREPAFRRLSQTSTGAESDAASQRPNLNYSGTSVLFDSAASNLGSGQPDSPNNVFRRSNPLTLESVFVSSFE